jgi:hypothetical protein
MIELDQHERWLVETVAAKLWAATVAPGDVVDEEFLPVERTVALAGLRARGLEAEPVAERYAWKIVTKETT